MARLFEVLKGEAKEAVDSLMVAASSAKIIMDKLELRFANCDNIVERIIQDVQKFPRVNTSTKSDLSTFATKIRNSVAAMQALKHTGHLHNPDLIKEIINKLQSFYELSNQGSTTISNFVRVFIQRGRDSIRHENCRVTGERNMPD